jgi:hypothetical protein
VLFGGADKVTGIYLEEKTRTLVWPVDSPPWQCPWHDALRVRKFLGKKSITKIDHPLYSPDLALLRFLALSKIKKRPEGTKICWHS